MKTHSATAQECSRLWPAVSSDRLMESQAELEAYRAQGAWRVRVAGRGEAALLGVWRLHLDVLAMRGVWCSERHVPSFTDDAFELAREHGFPRVLSPLLPTDLLGGYRRAGMLDLPPIVAIQGIPARMRTAEVLRGVVMRCAEPADADAIAVLDEQCFDDFWRYSAPEILTLLQSERCMLAEDTAGDLIGYTLATVSRGAAVLSRLCTSPRMRRAGVGAFLLSDVGEWCRQEGASTIALCTQEENAASRALYASAGLVEIDARYGFALREV